MTKIDKIKDYMELCGINQKEICETKTYTKSKPFLNSVLNGKSPMPNGDYELIMRAISEARATKIIGVKYEQNVDEQERNK